MCPSDTVVALQMWPLTSHNATQINHQAVNITAGWEESENEVGIFPNEDRGKFYWYREHEEKGGEKPGAQKFPNLEVGFSEEYLCVLKKVSLSHGKKIDILSLQILPHRALPLPFVYISHSNTFVLLWRSSASTFSVLF